MIDYLAPSPFTPSPDAGVSTPILPGPPMGPPPGGLLPPGPGGPPPGAPGIPLPPPPGLPMGGPPNGIPGAMGPGAAPYPMPQTPATMKYTNETQQDGTVLLRVQNPDGSPGPIVQIIKPPTAKQGK